MEEPNFSLLSIGECLPNFCKILEVKFNRKNRHNNILTLLLICAPIIHTPWGKQT